MDYNLQLFTKVEVNSGGCLLGCVVLVLRHSIENRSLLDLKPVFIG